MEIKSLLEHAQKSAQSGQYDHASEFCHQVLAQDRTNAPANYILGRILAKEGKYDDAIDYFLKALATNPGNFKLAITVGRLLRLAERPADAANHLRSIPVKDKLHPLCLELGLALLKLGRLDEAYTELFNALILQPDCKISSGALVKIAHKRDREEDTLSDLEKILRVSKNKRLESEIALYNAQNQLIAGDAYGSLASLENLQSNSYLATAVLAHKYIAMSELDDREGVDFLYDYDKLIKHIPATYPAQFGSIGDFNSYLANYLLFNQTTVDEDMRNEWYSTINGQQTGPGQLFNNNATLGNEILKMIGKAFDAYLEDMSDLSDHPLLANRPLDRFVEVWSVVLNYQGHQKQHIHPTSWLSGCYYIQLPDDFDSQPEPTAGHLEFGQPPDDYRLSREPKTLTIKPVPGEFIIFPSYFWHRTIPLLSNHPRICIAFDWSTINAGVKVV